MIEYKLKTPCHFFYSRDYALFEIGGKFFYCSYPLRNIYTKLRFLPISPSSSSFSFVLLVVLLLQALGFATASIAEIGNWSNHLLLGRPMLRYPFGRYYKIFFGTRLSLIHFTCYFYTPPPYF